MLIAAMGGNLVLLLIFMSFAIGEHFDQDSKDLEARSALPQPSLVDLGAVPFGGIPRQREPATPSDDSTEQSKSFAQVFRFPVGCHVHNLRSRYPVACAPAHSISR